MFRRKGDEIGLAFSEQPSKSDKNIKITKPREIKVWGLPFKVMTETILKTLKRQGYRPTALSAQREAPFILDEISGVRLGLFFFSLKPLRNVGRMEEIVSGIDRMSDEEVYYWYAKCTNGRNALKSRRALRILLSGE
ncbi:MAG: hypothetical protein H8E10_19015 [Desulfobacterales bacterium]|nr:hypothetical protein [Desulfobacterales bacterium]